MLKMFFDEHFSILAPPLIDLGNETTRQVIRRNESLTISCPAEGYPSPVIRWFVEF